MARLTIEISAQDHAAIKMAAAKRGLSIKDWFFDLVYSQAAPKQKKFNKTTRKVIEDADKGINITKHKSSKAMFEYLDSL